MMHRCDFFSGNFAKNSCFQEILSCMKEEDAHSRRKFQSSQEFLTLQNHILIVFEKLGAFFVL